MWPPRSERQPARPRASAFLSRGKPKLLPPELRDKVAARRGHGRDRGEEAGRLCYGAAISEVDQGIARPNSGFTAGKLALSSMVPPAQALRGKLSGGCAFQLPDARKASLPGGSPARLPPRAGRRQLRTHVGNECPEGGRGQQIKGIPHSRLAHL